MRAQYVKHPKSTLILLTKPYRNNMSSSKKDKVKKRKRSSTVSLLDEALLNEVQKKKAKIKKSNALHSPNYLKP